MKLSEYLKLQMQEALGSENRWYCSQYYHVPGFVEAREMFENAIITDCLISLSGGERALLDFDPETGKIWD